MDIQDKNLLNAYNTADENSKRLLRAMFPDFGFEAQAEDKRDITERVKTFEDACKALGETHELVQQWRVQENDWIVTRDSADFIAYMKLRIICAALNEGWTPQFTEDEEHWYPWCWLYTEEELSKKSEEWKRSRSLIMTEGEYTTEFAGFATAYSSYASSNTYPYIGSRLCLKSEALSDYCGRQFAALWADFYLIRK